MNRTLLVARREFTENLRTKTFWLGILAFPVILVLSVLVTRFFADQKEVRSYAVLDLSEGQWLSKAVEAAATNDIIADIFGKTNRDGDDAPPTLDPDSEVNVDEALDEITAAREKLDNPKLQELLDIQAQVLEASRGKTLTQRQLMFAAAGPVMKWMAKQDPDEIKSLFTAGKYKRIPISELEIDSSNPEEAEKALAQALDDEKIFGFFVINDDPEASDKDAFYSSNNKTDSDLRQWYSGLATKAVRDRRVASIGINKKDAALIRAPFRFESMNVSAKTGEKTDVTSTEKAYSYAPVGFVYLLWIAVFTAAQMLLTNTVEEKSNRIIEVLLSSVSPLQLMAGKVWGIAATGLTIVGSWVLVALIGVKFAPVLFPGMPADFALMDVIGDPLYLASFVIYFLAGYLLYAAFLVAIGSVCNSLKEAQNLMQPVFIVLVIPMLAMIPIVNDPNGTVAKVMTYIPLFTPFAMMNRAGGPPPAWEYVASGVLLLVSILIAFWAAGKVFRIGVLMTGKPPKFREILGWIKAPVGAVHVQKNPSE